MENLIIEDVAGYVDEIDGSYDDIITTVGDDEYEVHHIESTKVVEEKKDMTKSEIVDHIETTKVVEDQPKSIIQKDVVEDKKEEKVLTKADIARQIFAEKYKKVTRKEVIEEFMKKAGLTKAGAATYYQNFVQKAKK